MKNDRSPASGSRRWLVVGVGFLAVAVLVGLWNSGKTPETAASAGKETSAVTAAAGASATGNPQGEVPASPQATRSTLRGAGAAATALVPGAFPHVERILADTSLTSVQAAQGLFGIIRSGDLSEAERYEALTHGLNLDFATFLALPADPALPATLAQRYLDVLTNCGHEPRTQIEGCLALMNHGDESIRAQATRQLAFLVESEDLETQSPAELRRLATERIEALKQGSPAPLSGEP